MKRPFLCLVFGLASVTQLSFAGPLAGTWRIAQLKPGGVTLQTFLVLDDTGENLVGRVIVNNAVSLPLRQVKSSGGQASFSNDWGFHYEIKRHGDALDVILRYSPGYAETLSAEQVDPREAAAPERIATPAPAPVPRNNLAATPPMGWNSWNHFHDAIDDKTVRECADALVATGMAEAGYIYVNIDDGWAGERDQDGNLRGNSKFPDMKALADYVHARGLRLGIYSSPGPVTCGGYEGSYGHEEQDAKTFARWGVDLLKYDWCSASRIYSNKEFKPVYQRMGEALAKCGRPIVYSVCQYGGEEVWTWAPSVGANLWRTTGDIQDNWESMSQIGFNQDKLAPFASPGAWNDPDMLEVGNGGMTPEEYRSHFSLWCLLAAPLMAGNDIRQMSDETRQILLNRRAIAIDQDPLGRQAERRLTEGDIEVWSRPLADGAWAVGLFNRGTSVQTLRRKWSEVGLPPIGRVENLWSDEASTEAGEEFSYSIPIHGVVFLKVSPSVVMR